MHFFILVLRLGRLVFSLELDLTPFGGHHSLVGQPLVDHGIQPVLEIPGDCAILDCLLEGLQWTLGSMRYTGAKSLRLVYTADIVVKIRYHAIVLEMDT